jgi:hypothetical protein
MGERMFALLVAAGCLSVLIAGFAIQPDSAGHGSHTQLGLPPCLWAVSLNRPCPTCGMTTAVSHATHGQLIQAFRAQPFGLFVAIGTAVGFWIALHVALTGSQLGSLLVRMLQPRALWTLAALALASWAYKWANWPVP